MSREQIKVLHILANSRPDLNGYAVRTHDLLMAQWDSGEVKPVGLTSPFYPERESLIHPLKVDEIEYLRCVHPLHDTDATGLSSWWLTKRARKKHQRDLKKPSRAKEPPSPTLIDAKSPLISHDESDEEVNKLLLILLIKPLRFSRKVVRHAYRFAKRSTRVTIRFFIRASRKTRRFTRRNVRRLTRPVRMVLRPFPMWIEERFLMRKMTRDIIRYARQESAQIIHAHTPYRVGRPALIAARKLNLPFVYEMRGIWEDTAVANGRWKQTGLAYRRYRAMETKVLTSADRVICISETLAGEAISRGVDPSVVYLVQNAVDPEKISQPSDSNKPATEEEELHLSQTIESLNRSKKTCVVGYIGSLRALEGVDLTADAVARLHSDGHDIRLLVVSGKANQEELRERCESLELGENVIITGPVSHERVPHYYGLIDIFVVSRPNERVTRLVTPLKPFEAMMMERAVIVSDLPALVEIIEDGVRGLCFKAGDESDLAEKINYLMNNPEERERLGSEAQQWVESERTWPKVIKGSLDAYQELI